MPLRLRRNVPLLCETARPRAKPLAARARMGHPCGMVHINRVYTRAGDDGSTALGGGQRVAKDSLRIEAYGTVDELNSVIGVAVESGMDEAMKPQFFIIQQVLFNAGSDLCILQEDKQRFAVPGIEQRHVDALADILWWIQGRIDADCYEPFDSRHVDALREARIIGMQDVADNIGAETEASDMRAEAYFDGR